LESNWATTYFLVEIYRNKNDGGAWYLRPTNVFVYLNADMTPIRDAMAKGLATTIRNIGQGI